MTHRISRAAAFAMAALALLVTACGDRGNGGETTSGNTALLQDRAADAPRAETEVSTRFE